MPTTANSITYFVAADGTLRDGPQGSIAQTPRINYGTEYAVTLSFPPSTIAEGDQLQVALNRTRTFFSSASATGDAPVAAVAKHDVTAEEAAAQEVAVVLSTNTRAMIDQVNGIDHPVRGFFGVHILRGQSFVTLAVADALMMSLESGPDAISPSLPVVDYPTREEAEALAERSKNAAERAEEAAAGIVPPLQLSSPPTTSTIGSVGQLAVWHDSSATDQSKADHEYHLLYIVESAGGKEYIWREDVTENKGNVAGGYPVLDENAKVPSGQLPIATSSEFGVVKFNPPSSLGDYGVFINSFGVLTVAMASNKQINNRNAYPSSGVMRSVPIVPNNLNYAVTAALTDANHITLTDAQKAIAQSVFGVGGPITAIPAATSAYTLAEGIFTHAPTSAPTYTLPSITDDIRTHEVVLVIDFSSVQTFSFLVDGGGDVTFQSYANPTMGDVWAFRCWWYGGKWRIAPTKIKNCVTRQLANGYLAITDAVGGDALALKMAAPRSVVVNQLVNWETIFNNQSIATYNASCTYSDTYATVSTGSTGVALGIYFGGIHWDSSHIYLCCFEAKSDTYTGGISVGTFSFGTYTPRITNVWGTYYKRFGNASDPTRRLFIAVSTKNISFDIRNVQLVDLTQYFNGDSALIDSITSWDDLVAYDPRFAQYVAYNTGEVKGVVPAVSVNNGTAITSPDELFAVGTAADEFEAVSGVTTMKIGSYTFTGSETWTYSYIGQSDRRYGFSIAGIFTNIKEVSWTSKANIILEGYLIGRVYDLSATNETSSGAGIRNDALAVFDSSYTDATTFAAHMAGKTIYYELATPTTSPSTPTQISLQAGSNVAMQTDGGRLAPIDITYESDEL